MSEKADSAGQAEETDNLSVEDLVTETLQQQEVETPEEETEETETEDEESEEAETEETEEEEETEDEGEESEDEETETETETTQELDLDNISDDDLIALAKRLPKSGSIKRINQLLQRAKEAEAKVTFLESERPKATPTATNPFGHLSTKEEVETKKVELEDVIDKTDELLDENVGLGADDLIEYQGKEFTVRDVRAANRNSRKALDKLLPQRLAEIKEIAGIAATREQAIAAVADKFPELADEDSNISKSYHSMLSGEDVTALEDKHPKLWAQMPGILALAAVGLDVKMGKSKKKVTTTGKRPRTKAPSSPVGSGTGSTSSKKSGAKAAEKEFEESGSVEALERMLLASGE